MLRLQIMQEYLSEAIILNREPVGELDARLSVFTKKFGKFAAKAKSVSRITSKLAGHLEAGNLADVRIVEKNGLQIADALKKRRLDVAPADLYHLDLILAEAEPEPQLWRELVGGGFSWGAALRILGWDPKEAACGLCHKGKPAVFGIREQEFFCRSCASKLNQNELIFI